METHPPVTSTDGSRNTPERCPRPLYSRGSPGEHDRILRCYQYKRLKHFKTEKKEDAKETFLTGDEPCKEEEKCIKISTEPGCNRTTQIHIKAEDKEERHVKIKEEAIPIMISTEPRETRITSRNMKAEKKEEGNLKIKEEKIATEISIDPGATRDTQRQIQVEVKGIDKIKEERHPPEISTELKDTRAAQTNVKVEDEEKRVKAKRKILEIGMDGRYRWYNTEKYPDSEIVDDDITAYVAKEKAKSGNLQPVCYKEEKPYSCPECGKRFTHEKYLIIHYRCHSGEKPFFCAECGKSFPYRSSLDKHKITHTAVGAFPCPECGKRFRAGWILAAHRRVHSTENVHR